MANINTLPTGVICPQLGEVTRRRKTMQHARKSFNGQRWRSDMRNAVTARDWETVAWMIRHYDAIMAA